MKKYQKLATCSLILAILFNLTISGLFAAELDSNPIITAVIQDKPELYEKPLIIGLNPDNSEVMVYLNGVYEGNANINREQTGTDNFFYQINRNLTEGLYKVTVVAKDRTSLRLSNISNEYSFSIKSLPAPTLIQPDENTITGKVKPFITGLTVNNTKVHLFIDGVYNGKTDLLNHESGTANFKYVPFLNLAPGWHTAYAKSEDLGGHLSVESNVLHFRIENSNPAPTLIASVANNKTNANQPFISGVAKNNSKVRIFIDKKLNGEFLVTNNESGTAHFSYKPFLALNPGRHMVYATALDSRGKESIWSNVMYFSVGEVLENKSSDLKSEEQEKTSVEDSKTKTEEQKEVEKIDSTKDTDSSPEVNSEVKDILNSDNKGTSTDQSGSINESKESQGKLKLNLIIFIIFLFMVIAWIFWVNRELIKERRDQNEKD